MSNVLFAPVFNFIQMHLLVSCIVIDSMLMVNLLSNILTNPATSAASNSAAASGTGSFSGGPSDEEPLSLTLQIGDYCSGASELGKCYKDLDGLVCMVNSAVDQCTAGKQVRGFNSRERLQTWQTFYQGLIWCGVATCVVAVLQNCKSKTCS